MNGFPGRTRMAGWGVAAWMAAAAALAGTYEVEFQSISEGGGTSASATFEAAQVLNILGAPAGGESATYLVTNVLSFQDSQNTGVEQWMLY